MLAEIAKTFTFEAAHHLPNHGGKCRRPHGHSYRVEVVVQGEPNGATGEADEGMLIDFAELSRAWAAIEPLLDHQDLNETIGPEIGPTTAERIAAWILGRFAELIPPPRSPRPRGVVVTVWETPTCRATAFSSL